jgi:hypothetical protein
MLVHTVARSLSYTDMLLRFHGLQEVPALAAGETGSAVSGLFSIFTYARRCRR